MTKLLQIMTVILLVMAVAGCSTKPDSNGDNPLEVEKAPEGAVAEPLPVDNAVYLDVSGDYYSMQSENIPYAIVNNSGQVVNVLLIPILERETATGWEKISTENVGFCGTPDTIENRWEDSVPLSWYADALEPGYYRLSFQLTGGDGQVSEGMVSDVFKLGVAPTTGDEEPAVWISSGSTVDMSDLNLYWQADNLQFAGDENAMLSIYVRAEKNDDGEFAFDDGQDWLVLLETSVGDYPLFPRQFVQLGNVSCVAFNDMEEVSHIFITVRQTAGYQLYDCVFDQERQEFKAVPVYDAQGINFITGSPL